MPDATPFSNEELAKFIGKFKHDSPCECARCRFLATLGTANKRIAELEAELDRQYDVIHGMHGEYQQIWLEKDKRIVQLERQNGTLIQHRALMTGCTICACGHGVVVANGMCQECIGKRIAELERLVAAYRAQRFEAWADERERREITSIVHQLDPIESLGDRYREILEQNLDIARGEAPNAGGEEKK